MFEIPEKRMLNLEFCLEWRFQILKKLAEVQRRLRDETQNFGIILVHEGHFRP